MAYTMTESALAARCRGADTNRRRRRIFVRTSASIDKGLAEQAKSLFGSVMNAVEFAVSYRLKRKGKLK